MKKIIVILNVLSIILSLIIMILFPFALDGRTDNEVINIHTMVLYSLIPSLLFILSSFIEIYSFIKGRNTKFLNLFILSLSFILLIYNILSLIIVELPLNLTIFSVTILLQIILVFSTTNTFMLYTSNNNETYNKKSLFSLILSLILPLIFIIIFIIAYFNDVVLLFFSLYILLIVGFMPLLIYISVKDRKLKSDLKIFKVMSLTLLVYTLIPISTLTLGALSSDFYFLYLGTYFNFIILLIIFNIFYFICNFKVSKTINEQTNYL